LARAGYDVTNRSLSFLSSYANETDYLVWSEIVSRLNSLKVVSSQHPQIIEKINTFYKTNLTKFLAKLGWDFTKDDSYETLKMRQLVISTLAGIGEPTVLETCKKCFADFIQGLQDGANTTLNSNIRFSVFVSVIRFSETGEEFVMLKDAYRTVNEPAIRVEILKALGSTRDGLLLKQALDFAFKSGEVRTQDMDYVLLALAPGNSIVAWKYITDNWKTILSIFGNGGMGLLHGLVCYTIGGLWLKDEIADAKAFLTEHDDDVKTIRNGIKQEFEENEKYLEWFNRDRDRILEWCESCV
jgi:aminopeptidase 2